MMTGSDMRAYLSNFARRTSYGVLRSAGLHVNAFRTAGLAERRADLMVAPNCVLLWGYTFIPGFAGKSHPTSAPIKK